MTRILLPLALALSCTSLASAQFAIDFNAGANRSNLPPVLEERTPASFPELKDLTGYFIGVTPSYRFGERLRGLLGVQYSVKGYIAPSFFSGQGYKVRLGYLDFVPELEWRPAPVLGLSLGGYLGVNTSERFGSKGNLVNDLDLYSATDLGAVATARLYRGDFFAMARYAHGFADLADFDVIDANGALVTESYQQMRCLQVGVGYRLGFRQNEI